MKFITSFLTQKWKTVAVILVAGLIVGVAGVLVWKYAEAQQQLAAVKNGSAAEKEISDLVKAVGKHAILPNESPTIATVTDEQKLIDEPFFSKARNGDRVLIFSRAAKVYLYRPETDQIVDIGTMNAKNVNPDAAN